MVSDCQLALDPYANDRDDAMSKWPLLGACLEVVFRGSASIAHGAWETKRLGKILEGEGPTTERNKPMSFWINIVVPLVLTT